jgi:acylglycerol lipase
VKFKSSAVSLLLLLGLASCTAVSAQFMQLDGEPIAVEQPPTPTISWVDESVPIKGYLLCVHGLGLHKGTYAQFGERMAKLGWGVFACDVRGFGSFKELGMATTVDFPGCLEDVSSALDMVRAQAKGKPVFIVGESMGGAIALRVASQHPDKIDGLISSVPGGARHGQAGDSLKVGLHLLGGAHKEMDVRKIVVDKSTTDPKLKEEWLSDHLARFNISPVELIKFQNFMAENGSAAKKISAKTPVLFLCGEKDRLVKTGSNIALENQIPHATLIEVAGKEHLLLEEGQFDDSLIAVLTQWLADFSPKH